MHVVVELESTLRDDWLRAMRIVAEGARTATQAAIDEGAAEARSAHRYKDRDGSLTRSIRGRLDTFDRFGAEGTIEATAEYASFVENGTKAHDIWPKAGHGTPKSALKNGQGRRAVDDIGTHRVALRWYSGGAVHFASMVHHPGSKPYPFMGLAYLKAERVLEREIEVAVVNAQAVFEK